MILIEDFMQPHPIAGISLPSWSDGSLLVDVTGYADSGRTLAWLAQWKRKDQLCFLDVPNVHSSFLEVSCVCCSFLEAHPKFCIQYVFRMLCVLIDDEVKKLSLDVYSFVPVGTTWEFHG